MHSFWNKKLFKNDDQPKEFPSPVETPVRFILSYKSLIIGDLTHESGKWIFKYSEEFKAQDKIGVLLDFPNKDKVYESSLLWPFFSHRIPGLGQPQVKNIIKRENIDATNEIALLRRFGKRTITNPFELAFD